MAKTKKVFSWACWCMAIIKVLERLRQKDHEFEDSLGYPW
jgi:hypothetical protein